MLRAHLVIAALAGVAAWSSATSSPAAAQTVSGAWQASYGVSLIGLPIGNAQVTAALESGRYRLEVQARLTGLAGMVTGGRGAGQATGQMAAGRLSSSGYSASGSNGRESRTVRMAVASGAATAIDISPPVEKKPDAVPLTEAHRRGITDPVSALLMPVPQGADLSSPSVCNRLIPIFDGNARYDIQLSHAGTRTVQGRGYSGPVAVCNARFVPIAGHRNGRSTRFMADNRDMQTWLAPLPGTNLVAPYRIAVRSELGMVVIEATRFEGGAQDAAATTASTPAGPSRQGARRE